MNTANNSVSEWLWLYMADLYGGVWTREHGKEDERGTWTAALSKYHPTQIKQALADCLRHYPDWPPTLGQFRALVKLTPNPDAPLQLDAPKNEKEQNAYEWLQVLKKLFEEAKNAPSLTEEQREYHRRVLGLDAETLAKKTTPYFEPGSHSACAYPGCCGPGALSRGDSKHWYCREHFQTG